MYMKLGKGVYRIYTSSYFSSPQTHTNSELSGKASLTNGHHAEPWKVSKSENPHEKSEKIKVRQATNHFPSSKKD